MQNNSIQTHSFTIKSNGIQRMLAQKIQITGVNNAGNAFSTFGIWDTGATGSVITKEVAAKLGIVSTGMTTVNTASQTGHDTETYLVDIFLKNDLRIQGVEVTIGTIDTENGIDCLIGMDIITIGDFSITNLNGKTCMSFRIPSQHEIDFVDIHNTQQAKLVAKSKQFPNELCKCGSRKKYKDCHGRR